MERTRESRSNRHLPLLVGRLDTLVVSYFHVETSAKARTSHKKDVISAVFRRSIYENCPFLQCCTGAHDGRNSRTCMDTLEVGQIQSNGASTRRSPPRRCHSMLQMKSQREESSMMLQNVPFSMHIAFSWLLGCYTDHEDVHADQSVNHWIVSCRQFCPFAKLGKTPWQRWECSR